MQFLWYWYLLFLWYCTSCSCSNSCGTRGVPVVFGDIYHRIVPQALRYYTIHSVVLYHTCCGTIPHILQYYTIHSVALYHTLPHILRNHTIHSVVLYNTFCGTMYILWYHTIHSVVLYYTLCILYDTSCDTILYHILYYTIHNYNKSL